MPFRSSTTDSDADSSMQSDSMMDSQEHEDSCENFVLKEINAEALRRAQSNSAGNGSVHERASRKISSNVSTQFLSVKQRAVTAVKKLKKDRKSSSVRKEVRATRLVASVMGEF